jgi:hypothetical protein
MMIKEAYLASTLIFLLLVGRLLYLWAKGSMDLKSMTRAVELFGAIVMGTTVAMVVASEIPSSAQGLGLDCQRINPVYWECARWPVVSDFIAQLLSGVLNWFQAGAGIPAAAAPLLGNFYVMKKISEGDISPAEVFRAFCAGAFIFLVLIRLDQVLSFFNEIVTQLSFLSPRTEEGREVMARWAQNINEYSGYAKDNFGISKLDVILLWIGIGFLGLVINIGSTLFVMVQCALLIFTPIAFFRGLLFERADMFVGIRLTFTFSIFMLFNNLVWTIISFFPAIERPKTIGDEVMLGTSALGIMTNMVIAAFLIGLLYMVVGYLAYLIFTKTFGGDD